MRTTEEIIEKIRKMRKEEEKAIEECETTARYWESNGDSKMAERMKTYAKRYYRGYVRLSELLDYIIINKNEEN